MSHLKLDLSQDMSPLIDEIVRRATEHVEYRIEKHAEAAVVEILRSRGYTVTAPAPVSPEETR